MTAKCSVNRCDQWQLPHQYLKLCSSRDIARSLEARVHYKLGQVLRVASKGQ